MLPRSHRINGAQLQKTLPQSKPYRFDWGSVRIYPDESTKIACIVSKKIAKSSPDRHRIKRRLYSTLQPHLKHLKPGLYYIFPTKSVLRLTQSNLIEKIADFVQRHNK